MALLPLNVDYTDKDFDALSVRLFAMLAQVFPEWTDRNRADFGNMLLELFAHVGDVVTYYQDNQAAESRIATATQRRSLLGLAKLIGYVPPGAGAATVDVVLAIPGAVAGSVTFPRGAFVSTLDVAGAVRFQLLDQAVIPAGATSVTATVENSENVVDMFTSTGLGNQEFALAGTPYLDASAAFTAADGDYTQTDNFLSSTSSDKHFVVVVDQNDRARIRTGNGINGAIPVGTITVPYKIGGGADGNVEANAIKRVEGNYTDSFGTPVVPTVTQALASSGGRPRATNAQIKELGPASIRAPVNSVAREDFVINARRLPSVARALMLTSNEDVSVPENTGFLFVIPQGGGFPSTLLKEQVKTQVTVTYPSTLTFKVFVYDPVYKQIDITAIVFIRQGFAKPNVRASIVSALTEWFAVTKEDGSSNENVDFGANVVDENGFPDPVLPWSDIFNVIRDTVGVRKTDAGAANLLLNGVRADVTLTGKEFPTLGVVTLIDGTSGDPF